MERETKTITLPISQTTVEYKSYLTAREFLAIVKNKEQDTANKVLIDQVIVSIAGSKERIYEAVLDLRLEDYIALNNALTELIKTPDQEKKE